MPALNNPLEARVHGGGGQKGRGHEYSHNAPPPTHPIFESVSHGIPVLGISVYCGILESLIKEIELCYMRERGRFWICFM